MDKGKTAAERKQAERDRKREAGLVLVQEWVHSLDADKLKQYAEKLRKQREKGPTMNANQQRAIDAEARGSNWLAEGNLAMERGNKIKAEKCYDKAQFWLDRANSLAVDKDGRPRYR